MNRTILFALLITLLSSCDKKIDLPLELSFEFDQGAEGWIPGFADYPAGEEDFYELASAISRLPDPLPAAYNAFMLEGNNHSDDLFMFMKKQITGLNPNTDYNLTINLEMASNAAEGSFGIGGSPANSVYVKAGASAVEPIAAIDPEDGWLRMNIDKGNQAQGGADMIVLGDFSNGTDESTYILVARKNNIPFAFKTDNNGEAWLIVGLDSGFEGKTSAYINRIKAIIE